MMHEPVATRTAGGARVAGARWLRRPVAVPALLPPGTWDDGDPRMDAVPALGEHTDAILRELGLDAAAIARAARRGGDLNMAMLPRTYLFVPGDRPERFAKALASGADAIVLDLEDAVAAAAKASARRDARWPRPLAAGDAHAPRRAHQRRAARPGTPTTWPCSPRCARRR